MPVYRACTGTCITLVNGRDFLDCRVNMEKGMSCTVVKTSLQVNLTL